MWKRRRKTKNIKNRINLGGKKNGRRNWKHIETKNKSKTWFWGEKESIGRINSRKQKKK